MPEITLTNKDGHIKIYVNGLLHLCLRKSELIGIQSWLEGDDKPLYKIEFTTKSSPVLSEYDVRDKWETVLRLLDKENLFGKQI